MRVENQDDRFVDENLSISMSINGTVKGLARDAMGMISTCVGVGSNNEIGWISRQ